MRTRLLLLFTPALVFSSSANAQCTMQIFPSPGHVQVTTNSSINATGTVYWICSGLTVTILSSPGSVYLCESNVTLHIIDSDGDEVYAKQGCVINNSSDQDIGVTCNTSNVTLNNTGQGTITVTMNCTQVAFDYSMIGGPGSCASTGISEPELENVSIFPNPFSSFVMITGLEGKGQAKLYNALGDLEGEWEVSAGQHKFEMKDLSPGIYLLQVTTGSGVATKKIIKQ